MEGRNNLFIWSLLSQTPNQKISLVVMIIMQPAKIKSKQLSENESTEI